MTFADYAAEWIESYTGRTSRGIRPETLADYRRDLGLGPKGELLGDGATEFFGRIAFRGNPAAGLRFVQRVENESGEPIAKALTEEELRALLAEVPDEWRLFFELLAHTGLRIGEAIALTWADVDFGQRRLNVRRRLYRGRLDAPKSKYGRRAVPLSERLSQALWRHRGTAADHVLVFAARGGTHLDASNVAARVLKPAARRAGVPWAAFHTLRHTCATMLFRHGLNAKQVQMWLGHHSPAFTLAIYVRLLPDDLPDPTFLDNVTSDCAAIKGSALATTSASKPLPSRAVG